MEAKKKRTKNILFLSVVALLALGVALLPTILSSQQEEPQDKASYLSTQVQKQDIRSTISGWGTLKEETGVTVSVPRGVEVTGYLVSNGQMVEEGDLLAQVDPASVMKTIATVQENLDYLDKKLRETPSYVGDELLSTSVSGRVKIIYAQEGDAVSDVLSAHGALAVLSLDGLMALDVETAEPLHAGDPLTVVLPDGKELPGRAEVVREGAVTVTLTDDGPVPGDTAAVLGPDGAELGRGELYIHSAWNITAVSGTVSLVAVQENSYVYAGNRIFNLKDVDFTTQYRQYASLRLAYEETMLKLFNIYQNGAVTAPAAGCVSGVDTAKVGPMAQTGEPEYALVLLSAGEGEPAPNSEEPGGDTGEGGGDPAGDPPPALPADPNVEGASAAYVNKYAVVDEVRFNMISFLVQKDTTAAPDYKTLPGVDWGNTDPWDLGGFGGVSIFTWDGENSKWVIPPAGAGVLAQGDLLWFVYTQDEGGNLRLLWIIRPDQTVNAPSMDGFYFGGGGGWTEPPFEMYERTETQLMQVIPQDKVTVSVTIDEMDILSVAIGQEAEITVDALPGRSFTGTVTAINPQGSQEQDRWSRGSSKYDITILIDRDPDMLRSMNATAILTVGVTEDALTLPVEALTQRGSHILAYTGYDPEARTLLDPVEVTVGVSDGVTAQILDGLEEGDTVWYSYYETGSAPTFTGGSLGNMDTGVTVEPVPEAVPVG